MASWAIEEASIVGRVHAVAIIVSELIREGALRTIPIAQRRVINDRLDQTATDSSRRYVVAPQTGTFRTRIGAAKTGSHILAALPVGHGSGAHHAIAVWVA